MGDMTGEDVTATEGGVSAARPTPRVPMRERIVEAATELFYAQGLRAVSAEKIIAQVGITKVTFYRHFPTKDDLIVAYLERRARWERDAIAQARAAAATCPVLPDPGRGNRRRELQPRIPRLPVHQRRG